MKLLRLRLRHFRGIEGREIEFAPRGVTLVTGPNEIGKSSFAESLNLLFDEIDSTRKQRVQAVMPVDRDEGSEIEAELEIGPYRLSYSKRFHRSPYTRLQIHTPRVENHTGRAAHDRVLEILDECIDTDLWKALRVQQGESLFQQPLGDAAGLAAALDAAAGVGAEGARERGLLEATEREWARYFTPGGKHKIEIRRAAEQARAAADDLRACAERVDGLEAAVAREGELGAEIAAAERHEHEVEETLRGAARLHEQGLALRRASERCDAAREIALAKEREALAIWKQRSQLIAKAAAAETELLELCRALEETAPPLIAARGELAHARGMLLETRGSLEAAERADAQLTRDLEYLRGAGDYAVLARRLSRIAAAETALALAERQRDENPPLHSAEVDAIRDAELGTERARARLEAEQPRVRLTVHSALRLELDGRSLQLRPGEVLEESLAEFLSLSLPGVADLSVLAGAGATEWRKRLEEAETRLRTLCVEAGVDGHAGAVAALERRRDAERRVREARAALRDNLGEERHECLRTRAARLSERLERYPQERDPDIPLAPDVEAGRAALERARTATGRARRAREDADARHRSVEGRAQRLESERRDTAVRCELARESLTELRARLERARAEVSDEALEGTRDRSTSTAREAEAEARESRQALYACDPTRLARQVEEARGARRSAARRLRHAREEQRELRGLIAGQGDAGLHERCAQLEAEALEAEREHAGLVRRAAAARLLRDTLCEEREAARAGYAEPLRRHIEALGRELYGEAFAVTLSEELEVVRRQYAGIDLPEPDLSAGAREQLAILQRLALALAVAEPEGIPLLLDDALGHSDPTRREALARLLERVGERCQIIVLSCDPERYRALGCARRVVLD